MATSMAAAADHPRPGRPSGQPHSPAAVVGRAVRPVGVVPEDRELDPVRQVQLVNVVEMVAFTVPTDR
jgi:hypothetical protein